MEDIKCPYCQSDLTDDCSITKIETSENYVSIIENKITNTSDAETIENNFICANCESKITGYLNDLCENQIVVDVTEDSWG